MFGRRGAFLFSDIVNLIFGWLPGILSILGTCIVFIQGLFSNLLFFVLAPFIFVTFFISILFFLRLLLPPLKKGVYPVGFNRDFIAWYIHSALTRSIRIWNLLPLINSINLVRWLTWRALGAQIPFQLNFSVSVTFHDAGLISIGEHTTLSEGVTLSGHLFRGDKLFLGPVKIGSHVFIGRNVYIGPRTEIGDRAWIGMNHTLTRKRVEAQVKWEPFISSAPNQLNRDNKLNSSSNQLNNGNQLNRNLDQNWNQFSGQK